MAYNFNQGVQFMSDISGSDDSNLDTGIDFEENTIKLVANDQESLIVKSDKVGTGTAAPKHRLHVSGSPGTVAGLVVGDFYVTGSRAKLIVEETNGSDYRVVIDPVSGPLINFGSDTADNHYMTLGAFSSKNNLDTATRDFHLYGTNTTTGFYFDESAGRFGIGTASPTSNLDVVGSNSRSIATITGTSNAIGVSHSTVLMDASSGNCKAQLPTAVGIEGRLYTFKRTDNSANQCIVTVNGSETVDGMSGDIPIDTQYNSLTIQSNGSIWFIVAEVVYD